MRNTKEVMYPCQTMYRIGGGDYEHLHFDFSFIPYEQYTHFFNSLPNIIYKKCKNIRFSCDFEYQYSEKVKNEKKRNPKKEQLIDESIAGIRPKFLPYLIKILTRILPRTTRLEKIHISCMRIKPELLEKLIDAIGQIGLLKVSISPMLQFQTSFAKNC